MAKAWQYWTQVHVDGTLTLRSTVLTSAQAFWQQQFPQFAENDEVPSDIPRALAHQWNSEASEQAEICLRCFIAHQIKAICLSLARRFGQNYGFVAEELFPLVLYADRGLGADAPSLITKILQSWDPTKSTLASWVSALFRSDREIRRFLFEHGIEQLSDWLILCRTSPGQVNRYLMSICATQSEIAHSQALLAQFHAVYRCDRIAQRNQRYSTPTTEQLQRMAEALQATALSPEQVLKDLKDLAQGLRQERTKSRKEESASEQEADVAQESDEQMAFLDAYAEQLNNCLNQGIQQGLTDRLNSYQAKRPTPKAIAKEKRKRSQFLQALGLFYCQGLSTTAIAETMALGHQSTATRLLALKPFHEDLARHTVAKLMACIPDIAKRYGNPEQVANVSPQQFLTLLNDEVQQLITEASAASLKNRIESLLGRMICQAVEAYQG